MPNTPRTKASQKRLESAVNAFHERYSSTDQFGQERWQQSLYPALLQSTDYVALLNHFVPRETIEEVFQTGGVDKEELKEIQFPALFTQSGPLAPSGRDQVPTCYERVRAQAEVQPELRRRVSTTVPFPAPTKASSSDFGQQFLTHWNMDAASVLAALTLRVQRGDRVLDLCAAPGGKSLVLAQQLFSHIPANIPEPSPELDSRTCLHTNELDTNRNKRLANNLQSYLPSSLFESKAIRILKIDASNKSSLSSLPFATGPDPERYDKVLVDAPCSSERHILHAHAKAGGGGQIADEMMNWKSSHSVTLAKIQVGLLTTALRAVKMSGRVVYATCALGVEENDGVIERVLDNIKKERKREKGISKAHMEWAWDVELEIEKEGTTTGEVDDMLDAMTELTKYGRIALPDKGGWGPLYFCVMTKVAKQSRKKKTKNAEEQGGAEIEQPGETSAHAQISTVVAETPIHSEA